MDPDVAWATAQDESLSVAERVEAVDGLRSWFDQDGFLPVAYSAYRWSLLCDWAREAQS